MVHYKLEFDNSHGALVCLMGALSDARINNEKVYFDIKKTKQHFVSAPRFIGYGMIVVRDEERESVHRKLLVLAEKHPDLGLEIVGIFYDVTIRLPNEPGALFAELQKLEKEGVEITHIETGYKNSENQVFTNMVFCCSPIQYNLAKQALGEIIQDESPFLATAVYDCMP